MVQGRPVAWEGPCCSPNKCKFEQFAGRPQQAAIITNTENGTKFQSVLTFALLGPWYREPYILIFREFYE